LAGIVSDHIGGVRAVELVGTVPWCVRHSVLEDDLLGRVYDYCTVVELVCDGGVAVGQANCVRGKWARVAVRGVVCEVLEDDALAHGNFNHAAVA